MKMYFLSKIYTPEDIGEKQLIVNDRSYAGWTYFSLGLQSKTLRKLDTVEMQVGMVGPASFAEEAQKAVHTHLTGDNPNGWDNQLENEPGIALIYEHRCRLFDWNIASGLNADFIPHIGGKCAIIALGYFIPLGEEEATLVPESVTN